MTRRRIIVVALTAGIIAIVTLLWPCNEGHPIVLSSGAGLTLQSTEIGRSTSHYFGSALTRLAEKLPLSLQRYLPRGQECSYSFQATNLVFWLLLDRRDPLLVPVNQPGIALGIPLTSRTVRQPSLRSMAFTLQSEQGTHLDLSFVPSAHPLGDGRYAICLSAADWPRSSRTIRLNAFQPGLDGLMGWVGNWEIRNPLPVPIPSWTRQAQSLPLVQVVNNATFTLDRFELLPMPCPRGYAPWTNQMEPTGFLKFRVSRPETQAAVPIDLKEVRLQDVHGNHYSWRSDNLGSVDADDAWSCGLKLPCPGDGPYQIETLWLSKTPHAAGELTNILVPLRPMDRSNAPSRSILGGRDFQILVESAPNLVDPDWILRTAVNSPRIGDPLTPKVTLLEAVDYRGRRWRANRRGEIAVPDEVEEVTITLGIRAWTPVTFTAAPVSRTNSFPARIL